MSDGVEYARVGPPGPDIGLGIKWHHPKQIVRVLEPLVWMTGRCRIQFEPWNRRIQISVRTETNQERCSLFFLHTTHWTETIEKPLVMDWSSSTSWPTHPRSTTVNRQRLGPSSPVLTLPTAAANPDAKHVERGWTLEARLSSILDLFRKANTQSLVWKSISPTANTLNVVHSTSVGESESSMSLSRWEHLANPSFDSKPPIAPMGAQQRSLQITSPGLLQTMIAHLASMDNYFQAGCLQTVTRRLEKWEKKSNITKEKLEKKSNNTKEKLEKKSNTNQKSERHGRTPHHWLVLQSSKVSLSEGRYIVPIGVGKDVATDLASAKAKTVPKKKTSHKKSTTREGSLSSSSSSSSSSKSSDLSSSLSESMIRALSWAQLSPTHDIPSDEKTLVPVDELRTGRIYEMIRPIHHVWTSPDTWERHSFSLQDIREMVLPALSIQSMLQVLLAENVTLPTTTQKIGPGGEMEFAGRPTIASLFTKHYESKFAEWKDRASVTQTPWHQTDPMCKRHEPNLPIHAMDPSPFAQMVDTLQKMVRIEAPTPASTTPMAKETKESNLDTYAPTEHHDQYARTYEWQGILIVPRELNRTRTIMLVQRIFPLDSVSSSGIAVGRVSVRSPGASPSETSRMYILTDEAFFFVSQTAPGSVSQTAPGSVSQTAPMSAAASPAPASTLQTAPMSGTASVGSSKRVRVLE